MKLIKYLIFFSILVVNIAFSKEKPPFKNILVLDEPKTYEQIIFQDRDGTQIDLNLINTDEIYILNFWATWCAPCKEEMPHLDKLKSKSTFQDLEIIPINIADEELVKSKEFFEEIKIKNLEIFYGPSIELAKVFKLRGVPTTILIDKEGYEFARIIGYIDFENKSLLEWLSKQL